MESPMVVSEAATSVAVGFTLNKFPSKEISDPESTVIAINESYLVGFGVWTKILVDPPPALAVDSLLLSVAAGSIIRP